MDGIDAARLAEIIRVDFQDRVEVGNNFLPGACEASVERAIALQHLGAPPGRIIDATRAVQRAYWLSFTKRLWFTACGMTRSAWKARLADALEVIGLQRLVRFHEHHTRSGT